MVNSQLFDRLMSALREFGETLSENSEFRLVGLIPGEYEEKYKLLISAEWLDGLDEFAVIDMLVPFLRKHLQSEVYRISSVSAIHSSDRLVEDLTDAFPEVSFSKTTAPTITSYKSEINHIDKIHILQSHRLTKQNA